MDIRHLKIFISVVENESMNQAAKELFVSQPTISQAIREIEDYYHIQLFERMNKKLYITPAGEALLSHAYKIVEAFDEMEYTMFQSNENPLIRIGGSVSVGTALLPDLIQQFELNHPNIDMKVYINNTTTIETMLLNNELDLAITEGLIENESIQPLPIIQDELVIVVGKMHPFYSLKEIQLSDLCMQEAIMRENESNQRNQYEQILKDNNIPIKKKWYSTNTEAIKKAVMNSNKFAILSKLIIQNEVKNGDLKIVSVKGIHVTRNINLIVHKNKYINKSLKECIDFTMEHVKP